MRAWVNIDFTQRAESTNGAEVAVSSSDMAMGIQTLCMAGSLERFFCPGIISCRGKGGEMNGGNNRLAQGDRDGRFPLGAAGALA